jgi:ABC-type Fe3+/spermidine/putrescine transport system ATPase subunit
MTSTPDNGTNSSTAGNEPSSAKRDGIAVEDLSFAYGRTAVLRGISFATPPGTLLTLLGPSGCGKSTLLKLIAGDLECPSGRILAHGVDITRRKAEARSIGMVYQSYALFPHLTAWNNIAFPLQVRGLAKETIRIRVERILGTVGLSVEQAGRYPKDLSGGQQQRVALARALVYEPQLLLLDEPFANLDRHLRESLRPELRRIQREQGVTTILVTHDQDEAMALSDRIGILNRGRLLQIGPPAELYERPATPFVARFFGSAGVVPHRAFDRDSDGLFSIRPEQIALGTGRRSGTIRHLEYRGSHIEVTLEYRGELLRANAPHESISGNRVGEPIAFDADVDSLWTIPERDDES